MSRASQLPAYLPAVLSDIDWLDYVILSNLFFASSEYCSRSSATLMVMATSPNVLCSCLTYEYIFSIPLIREQLFSDELSNGHLCVIWPSSHLRSPLPSPDQLCLHITVWQRCGRRPYVNCHRLLLPRSPTLRAFFVFDDITEHYSRVICGH